MSAIDSDLFSLRWNNFHSNMITEFHALLQEEDLVDVTLAAGGRFTQAHKIVLSVCSPYFKELFKLNPCKHPIVILKDVGHKELLAILQFMYRGEVNVSQEDLTSFLKTAELLQIKGLTGDESGKIRQNNSVHSPVPRSNPVQSPVSRSIHRGETSSVNSNSKPQNLTKPRLPNLALIDDYVRSPPPQKRSRSSDTTPTHSNNRIYARIPSSDSIEDSKVITPEFFRVKDEPVDECDEEDGEIEQESVLLSENGKSRTKVKVDLHNSSSQPEGLAPTAPANLFASVSTLNQQDCGGPLDSSQDGRSVFGCKECEKTFTRRESLKTHVLNIHGKLRGPFACPLCGKLAKNKHSLSTHMYEYHRNSPNTNLRKPSSHILY